jgi:hypothetical protein
MKLRKTVALLLAVTALGGAGVAQAEEVVVQETTTTTTTTVLDTSAYTDTPVEAATAVDSGNDAASKPQYVTQQDLDALKDLIDEADKKKWNSAWTVNASGSLALGYSNSANNLGGDGKSGFNVSFATLNLAGNLREDPVEEFDVRYKVGLIFQGTSKDIGAINGAAANSSNTQVQNPVLGDAFLAIDLNTNKTNLEPFWVGNLTLGQQLIPFGQDNLAPEDQRPTIRQAQYLANLVSAREIGLNHQGGFINRYDPGSGTTTPLIAYWAAIWNGAGANRLDNNNEKAVNGRILITPEAQYLSLLRGLSFGGSIYHELTGGNSTTVDNARKVERNLYAWEFSWLRKPFLLTAEGVYGQTPRLAATVNPINPVIPANAVVGARRSRQYVATLFWTPSTLPDFQPLYRYDDFLSDLSNHNTRSIIHTLGFNWFIYQTTPVISRSFAATEGNRVLKAQFNWNLRQPAPNKAFTANDFAVQLVASF